MTPRIDAQKLFNKVQEELDKRCYVDAEPDCEVEIRITLAEARYLAELLGRFEIPELLK